MRQTHVQVASRRTEIRGIDLVAPGCHGCGQTQPTHRRAMEQRPNQRPILPPTRSSLCFRTRRLPATGSPDRTILFSSGIPRSMRLTAGPTACGRKPTMRPPTWRRFFLGCSFTKNTEFFVDVETADGGGVSDALGLAGFMNVDVVRNPELGPSPYLARAMVRQIIPLEHGDSGSRARTSCPGHKFAGASYGIARGQIRNG